MPSMKAWRLHADFLERVPALSEKTIHLDIALIRSMRTYGFCGFILRGRGEGRREAPGLCDYE